MKIVIQNDDGSEVDVTEGAKIAYDAATESMDWGSGFLDTEEMINIAMLGVAAGFKGIDRIAHDIVYNHHAITKVPDELIVLATEYETERLRKQAEFERLRGEPTKFAGWGWQGKSAVGNVNENENG